MKIEVSYNLLLKIIVFIFSIGILSCEKPVKVGISSNKSIKSKQQFVFSTDKLKRYKFPTHINDLIIDRSKSQYSEAFMVVIEPEKAPPFHKHDDTEQIFYMIKGTGTLTIGDTKEKFKVKPGDVVRIPISTFHSIQADKNDTLRYLCVDCFGGRPASEPTWDDHVKAICKSNDWDYSKVVSNSDQ